MPLYLGRFSYTTDAVKALINQPEDRSAAARDVAESLGGKLLGFWYAFGEFDGVFLMEAPDNASAAAVGMAVGASGALSEIETTVLLDMDIQFGMGFMVRSDLIPIAGAHSFGHFGAGGSMGWADPDSGLAFGYVMNRMDMGLAGDVRSTNLVNACIAAVS